MNDDCSTEDGCSMGAGYALQGVPEFDAANPFAGSFLRIPLFKLSMYYAAYRLLQARHLSHW